jgi:hypothetical protein
MSLIEEIKQSVEMEIRANSQRSDYLEGVISRGALGQLHPVLTRHLGPAAKEAGKEAALPGEIRETVDALGGLRQDQSFYYRLDGKKVHFAALWPWASNPEKITVKCGIME